MSCYLFEHCNMQGRLASKEQMDRSFGDMNCRQSAPHPVAGKLFENWTLQAISIVLQD